MKNLGYVIFASVILFTLSVSAQQDPHFSLYRNNMNIINPAYAGTNGGFETLFSVRSQWVTVEDSPESFNFNANAPVGEKLGLGLSIVSDKVFVLDETHLYADFSYQIQLSDKVNLFAGIKAGGSFINVDLNSLGISDDPLFTENVNTFNPNVGVGFYLRAPKYYVTLSAPGFLSSDRYQRNGVAPSEASDDAPIYLGAGYDIAISNGFVLKPSFMARAVQGTPMQLDLTTSGMIGGRFELGGNYRLDESVTIFTNFNFLDQRLAIGYGYEITTTDFGEFNQFSSHEVMLRYRFP